MKQKELSSLTDEALLEEAKRLKPTRIYDALIFGFLVGIAIYSTVKNSFGLLTFLPLIYLPLAARNNQKRKEVKKLLIERNLKD